jgi:hypothetical protein
MSQPNAESLPPAAVRSWHEFAHTHDPALLDALLADDVVFHSPVVHTPQAGKPITKLYLTAAAQVFFSEKFTYVREVWSDRVAFLEFATEIEGIHVNGVDILAWNADGKLTDFKVLIRPLKAINLIHRLMGETLERFKASGAPN